METLYNVKDKVIGGAKSAVGALTGNEDWQQEGEKQQNQAQDTAELKREELDTNLDFAKGKVYEKYGSATNDSSLEKEGKKLQESADKKREELHQKKDDKERSQKDKDKDKDDEDKDEIKKEDVNEKIHYKGVDWEGTKDKVAGRAKEAYGAATGKDDTKKEGEHQRERGGDKKDEQYKKESDDSDSKGTSTSTMLKDKVVGGAKSAVGTLTGNEEWKEEGERQRNEASDLPPKTYTDSSSTKFKSQDKDDSYHKDDYDSHRKEDEWQGTKDKFAGRAKEAFGAATGKDDMKREGEFQRERGEDTKSERPQYKHHDTPAPTPKSRFESLDKSDDSTSSSYDRSPKEDEWQGTKDKFVGRAKDAFGSATGRDDIKREGEFQRERGEDIKSEYEDRKEDANFSSQEGSTLTILKEKFIGGAKLAFGALTGNEEMQQEGLRQRNHPEETADIKRQEDDRDDKKEKDYEKEETYHQPSSSSSSYDRSPKEDEWQGMKDKFTGRAKEAFGAATGRDDIKREGEFQRERGEDIKSEPKEETKREETDSSTQHSSVMETLYSVKDSIVGGAKSAIGALTGNDDWTNEGEHQRDQTQTQPHDIVSEDFPSTYHQDSSSSSSSSYSDRSPKEDQWQGTKDKFAGRAKEAYGAATGREDIKREGEYQRERGEETKKEQEDRDSSSQQNYSSAMQTLYTVKDKVIGGAKSAIGSLTGSEEWKNEGERQKDQAHEVGELKKDELNANLQLKKGIVFEELGSKTENKDLLDEGKKMQKEARQQLDGLNVKEDWQGTKDKVAGRAKEAFGAAIGKDDMKKEGQFQRERGEATK